jgi:predicted ATPase
MRAINRIVISGAPATGKTTLCYALEKKGYPCFHEISREIIQRELLAGTDVLPWKNLQAFTKLIIAGRLRQFEAAEKELSFYDRSLIDALAYLDKDHVEIPKDWEQLAREKRYAQRVFITPPWQEIFVNDHERRESWQEVLHVHEYLVTGYEERGYEVVIIPKTTVAERLDFVLNQLP